MCVIHPRRSVDKTIHLVVNLGNITTHIWCFLVSCRCYDFVKKSRTKCVDNDNPPPHHHNLMTQANFILGYISGGMFLILGIVMVIFRSSMVGDGGDAAGGGGGLSSEAGKGGSDPGSRLSRSSCKILQLKKRVGLKRV